MSVIQTCPENEENLANTAGWEYYPLEEVFTTRQGYDPSKNVSAYWENGTIPFIKMEDIRNYGQRLNKSHNYVTEQAVKTSGVFPAGSFIISTSATIGEHALVTVPFLTNRRFTCLFLKPAFEKRLEREFIFYYLYMLGQWCRRHVNIGTKFAQVQMSDFRKFSFPIPPLPEQKQISTLLGSIEKAIDLERRCEESLTTIKRAAMHVVFTPANTAGWVKVKLGDICSYDLGKTPERDNPAYWKKEEGSVPWVKIADMSEHCVITETSEKISELAFHEVFRGRIVPAGTLLMSFKLTIGRIAYLGIPACHNEAIISIYPKEGVDKYYLGYFLSQVNYSGIFDRAVKGNTLNKGKIDRIPILLPPLHEQQEIVDFLTTLDQKLDIHRRKRTCLENIFRLFLHNLTRGTLRFTEFPEGCF
ncbi:MAG: restriction endonuclease subunit S [Acetobacter sp.]|nr:restriction endonuclease subunit S [Acetobacter sp.]